MGKGAALVTGASTGIGAELARICAADGYDVILVARRAEALESLASELRSRHSIETCVLPLDLADRKAAAVIRERTTSMSVTLLINNAGFGLVGPFTDMEWREAERMIQVNVAALAHLTRLFLPEFVRQGRGRILNVASTAAFVPGPFMAVYYATKAFVLSFSEALAEELKGTGVTVTALCPGPTRTEFDHASGAAHTNLFQDHVMDAAEVARVGYNAMQAGRAEVIAGARNRWMIRGTRLAPRTMLARIARRLNSPAR